MKHWAMAAAVLGAMLAGTMIGCEGDQSPEDTTEYDPTIDAPPSNLVYVADVNLIRNQALVAAEASRAVGTGGGASRGRGGAAPTDPNVVAVRGIMDKLIASGKTGQLSVVLEYLNDADSEDMRGALGALGELAAAAKDFNTAVIENLGMKEVPASLKQALSKGDDGGPILAGLGDLATDMLAWGVDAQGVTAADGKRKLKFVKDADGKWLIQLTPAEKQTYGLLTDLVKTQTRFVKTLATGIREGAITEHNLDAKGMALMEELIKPAMDKLQEATGAQTGTGAGTTQPATSAPSSGGTLTETP